MLTRNPSVAREVLPDGATAAAWNPEAGELAPDVIAGATAVVHLAGAGVADKRWSEARRRSILRSRVGGGEAVTRAIAALAPSQRPSVVIGASAVGYYGDRGDEELTEESAAGEGFLADVCRRWEDSLAGCGVRLVSLRIGVVLARDGGALARMLPPFRLGLGGRLGGGRQWMSWIHIDDLVALIVFAIERDGLAGPVNAVAPNAVTNADFTKVLARTVGRPAVVPVPAIVLRAALGELSTMLLGSQRVAAARADAAGFAWAHPDLEDALEQTCADPTKHLYREQLVHADIATVFEFFSDAYNLEEITPPFMHFRVLGLEPPRLGEGTEIRYTLRLRGVPMRWRSRIESWTPPTAFVDRQLRGPYALWHHTHEFIERGDGTLMIDRVRYRLPLGVLGDVVAGAIVASDLEKIFRYRFQAIERRFGSSAAPRP